MSISVVTAEDHEVMSFDLLGVEYKARTTKGAQLFYEAQELLQRENCVEAMGKLGQAVLWEQQYLRMGME